MLTRAAAGRVRVRRRKQAKATKATPTKKAKETYQTRCCACNTLVLSWRKGKSASFPITTTISQKFHDTCRHVESRRLHDIYNVSMCAACIVKFYKDDFVSGKITRCFAPGCTEITHIGRFMCAKDCVARKKNLPNPRKNPLPKELAKLMANGQVQRCPGCGLICQRIAGCGHMNCPQCLMNFNYVTGKPI